MQDQAKETKACVLGYPVSHSLSPLLHGYWITQYGLRGSYTRRETPPETLGETLRILQREGFAGCNLTVPLKEEALALVDRAHACARAVGAVNTLVFQNGAVEGYNSDGFGFTASLHQQAPGWEKKKAVIIGAGGAARAVAHALKQEGVERFAVLNRTVARAEVLAEELDLPNTECAPPERSAAFLGDASLLVHCTSLGMKGQPPLELDISSLPPSAVVADIVYTPLRTALLQQAAQRGNPVAEGLPMLLHQGRLGFKHWFGVDPQVTPELEQTLKEAKQWL